jgi:hypothetical protein
MLDEFSPDGISRGACLSSLAVDFWRTHLLYEYVYVGCATPFLERACRRDGIAMAVKAKRTSLSSLVRKEPKNDATDLT